MLESKTLVSRSKMHRCASGAETWSPKLIKRFCVALNSNDCSRMGRDYLKLGRVMVFHNNLPHLTKVIAINVPGLQKFRTMLVLGPAFPSVTLLTQNQQSDLRFLCRSHTSSASLSQPLSNASRPRNQLTRRARPASSPSEITYCLTGTEWAWHHGSEVADKQKSQRT